jgi:ATP-dependent protease ClpP protease subunit
VKFLFSTLILTLLCIPALASSKEIVLTENNTALLRGPVMPNTVADVMQQLNQLDKKGKDSDPIYLVLNTPGGSVVIL